MSIGRASSLLLSSWLFVNAATYGQEWLEFRGPNGSGHGPAAAVPDDWSGDAILWRTELPGRGWSSPVIAHGQIWLTYSVEVYADGKPRINEDGYAAPAARVTLRALCIDSERGDVVHDVALFDLDDTPVLHSHNTYASPTPVIDGNRVYVHFGTMGTASIDRQTAAVVWRNTELRLDHETGPGSSPVVWGELLIFHCDGTDTQFVAALNKRDGSVVWKRDRSGRLHPQGMMKKAFSTPAIVIDRGRATLISPGANWVYGYDPETGLELWRVSYARDGFSNVPRPVLFENLALICTGFSRPVLLAVDVQRAAADSENAVAWEYAQQVPTIPTPIVVGDLVFMVSDRGIATCLEARTGERHWQQRLGGDFAASPVFAGGKLLFCNKAGTVFLIAPTRDYQLLAKNEMGDGIWATPAIGEGQIYLRTESALYRIGQGRSQK